MKVFSLPVRQTDGKTQIAGHHVSQN